MAKTLDKTRPRSTIADMIDSDLIQQATQPPPLPEVPEDPDPPEPLEDVVAGDEGAALAFTAPATPPSPSAPNRIPGAGAGEGARTGEPSDIQKMYRLTPTALRTVQELSRCLSGNLGFEVSNSVIIRSVLRVVHQAEPAIHRLADERVTPRRQPSTAIGNEHARDALEVEIAGVIAQGIQQHSNSNNQN